MRRIQKEDKPWKRGNACDQCRQKKRRCAGGRPCRFCARNELECTSSQIIYSEAHVQRLMDRIEQLERTRGSHPPECQETQTSTESPLHIGVTQDADSESCMVEYNSIQENTPPDTPLQMIFESVSGPTSAPQIKSLLSSVSALNNLKAEAGINHHRTPCDTLSDVLSNSQFSGIPATGEQSQRLFDLFIFHLGATHHYLDPRMFTSNMALLHEGLTNPRARYLNNMQYIQYLLVMAIAELLEDHDNLESDRSPGWNYFAEAMRLLPPLTRLENEGILAVEALALVATYLQWADWLNEAYLYLGIAIRLALTLGINRPRKEQNCLPSSAHHRTRLWWTVYMLDRQLSSSLGRPPGTDDQHLDFEMPGSSDAFQSSVALSFGIKLVRTTDSIMTSLYKDKNATLEQLEQRMQTTLQSLAEIGRTFPPDLANHFPTAAQVSRTGASLILAFYKAIILCLRPVVLRQVRDKLQTPNRDSAREQPPALQILSRICKEVAKKTLAILSSLKQKGLLIRHGPLDCSAAFSSAFVLIMLRASERTIEQTPPPEVGEAITILRCLSDAGNKMADCRLRDIQELCTRVWRTSHQTNWKERAEPTTGLETAPLLGVFGYLMSMLDNHKLHSDGPLDNTMTCDTPDRPLAEHTEHDIGSERFDQSHSWRTEAPSIHPQHETFAHTAGSINNDESTQTTPAQDKAYDLYSCFHDPDLPLTGVDIMDWRVMTQRVFGF